MSLNVVTLFKKKSKKSDSSFSMYSLFFFCKNVTPENALNKCCKHYLFREQHNSQLCWRSRELDRSNLFFVLFFFNFLIWGHFFCIVVYEYFNLYVFFLQFFAPIKIVLLVFVRNWLHIPVSTHFWRKKSTAASVIYWTKVLGLTFVPTNSAVNFWINWGGSQILIFIVFADSVEGFWKI